MNTLNTFDNILNQSFQDEINRYNHKSINTSENIKVNSLFSKLQGLTTECNICYSENKCLQCYQCQFNYCEDCMTKVISEYNKCSACQADLINNYNKLETKNIELCKSVNSKDSKYSKDSKNINNNPDNNNLDNYSNYIFDDDYYSDSEISQITIAIQNSLNDNNDRNNSNNSNNSNNDNNNTVNVNKTQLDIYIEELRNNEILPFKITSLKHNNFTPNFTSYYDTNKKLLIYCPYDNKIPNIEINYKIFNTTFQLELRILLIQLLNFSNKFNNIWINIRTIINNFTNSYNKNKTNKNITNKNITDKNITDKNIINELLNEIKSVIQK